MKAAVSGDPEYLQIICASRQRASSDTCNEDADADTIYKPTPEIFAHIHRAAGNHGQNADWNFAEFASPASSARPDRRNTETYIQRA